VTDALDMVTAAGCPQQPILVLQPSAVSSRRSADSPRFIMGRRLQGGDKLDSLPACWTIPARTSSCFVCISGGHLTSCFLRTAPQGDAVLL
jgi:hypothetical protein